MEVIKDNIKDNTVVKSIDFDFINQNKEIFFINNVKDIGMDYNENQLIDFYNNKDSNILVKDIIKLSLLRIIYKRLPSIDKSSSILVGSIFTNTEKEIISSYIKNIINAIFTNELYFKNNVYNNQLDFIESLE